ncbi:hypothetical protein Megvenef_00340 [Candidatus Megaera venefica]|uniref:Uncharacterized protein n=1 Tax=Candidatus Megaera venefica TaxID=2055910 RepID=A0ABU5NB37_9RICK|nr:hypothetical protein [Candidatus Megaera venefica]MEA0970381.1 hypothetical protein [Candidatus Megaera venefica]
MAQLTLPVGKQEIHDGNSWFSLATENWVQNTIRMVSPCLVATTANLTAIYANGTAGVGATLTNSGTQAALVIDGVTLVVGNRVLVKDQATALQNGIYTVTNIGSVSTNWILTRTTDYDSVAQTVRGDTVSVISGTLSTASLWMLTSIVTTVGTDSFTFAKTDQNSFTSILGTTNQIAVSVTAGVATISIASNPVLPGTASVTIPTGTTVQRPVTPTTGMFRFNTSL